MVTSALRLLIAAWILFLLARAGRAAWQHRALIRLLWSRIRPRHVAGSLGLLVVVATVALTLIATVPGLGYGVGSLVGLDGNAVFAPLEEAMVRTSAPEAGGPDWWLAALTSLFLGYLVVLLPWLAFVEEEIFRAGLEDASPRAEVLAAVRFGLVHLVMLVPLGAALAIAVAGYAYSRVYRRAYARADGGPVPTAVARAFRPTRRSAAAAERARAPDGVDVVDAVVGVVDRSPERRQADAVVASAVWHTTFNTLVVVLLWASILYDALVPVAG